MAQIVKGRTQSLQFINDLMAFLQKEVVRIPTSYRSKVLETKKLLNDDTSGLLNTLLDFSISSALVDYKIESNNTNLSKVLNEWLLSINDDLNGRIPTGLEALAKEYFRERWKGSSHLLLRTIWTEKDGLVLPTTLFFVDGEDIVVGYDKNGPIRLGDEKYYIRLDADRKNDILLPASEDELIFVQRPYESWGIKEPVPYIIKKGLFRNAMFLSLLESKGENIVGKAIEYLFVMKKGSERMAIEGRPEMVYDENDLKFLSDDLKKLLRQAKSEDGTPTYTTNFDTELEHFIPDYQKILSDVLFSAIEKRILAGLGFVDIVEGTSSSRRESILNPKPFIEEVRQGIKDFKVLLSDLIKKIVAKNLSSHKKWMNAEIKIFSSPIKAFNDDKFRQMIRNAYDRGVIAKRTFIETGLDMDYDLQVQRRKIEKDNKDEDTMFPPVIQNQGNLEATNTPKKSITKEEKTSEDKKGVEKKNFNQSFAILQGKCLKCENEIETDINEGSNEEPVKVICPSCESEIEEDKDLEIYDVSGYWWKKRKKKVKSTMEN